MATGHKIGCKACVFLIRMNKAVQGYKDKLFEALILDSEEEEQAGVGQPPLDRINRGYW